MNLNKKPLLSGFGNILNILKLETAPDFFNRFLVKIFDIQNSC